jgi:hypothetical protein
MNAVRMSVPCRVRPGHTTSVEFDTAARLLIAAATGDGFDIAYRTGPGLVLDVRPRRSAGAVLRVCGNGTALSVDSTATPMAVAAVLLALRDATDVRPQCRFPWPPHHWLTVVMGLTGTAAQTREVLHRSEPDPRRRPVVRVGD